MSKYNIFVGTYTDQDSKGLYRFIFDNLTGRCDGPWLFYELSSCKALDYRKGELAVVCEQSEHAGVAYIDVHQPTAYHQDTKMGEEIPSCYITQDEEYIYTANYHEGSVLVYEKKLGKLRIVKRLKVSEHAKCHQVFFYEGYLFVVCLGLDAIKIYDSKNEYTYVKDIPFPKGSGPRHVVIDDAEQFLYVLSELSNEVFVYTIGPHLTFRCQQICSLIPKGLQDISSSAAIRLSSNGRFLYTSTRGANIITCFEIHNGILQVKGYYDCGGLHPRDFILEDSGQWLLVANKDSDTITTFKIDPETGVLLELVSEIKVPSPACLVIEK